MPITTIDRPTAEQIRRLVNEALAQVAAQHGIKLVAGRCKYTNTNATYELVASIVTADGVAQTPERTAYERLCGAYGLNRAWLDKTVLLGGTRYTVVGLKTSSTKYPVLLKHSTGKVYKFRAESVIAASSTIA